MAMAQPGMFLSQPPMATMPSKPSAPATVSMESAMTSRDTSEYRMPGVPIEIPSDTVMVLNSTPLPPATSTPATASFASSLMCMLHGVRFAHVEAMPICGLPKSASWNPTARSIARAGVCFAPSTTRREYARTSGVAPFFLLLTYLVLIRLKP
jgi:hypothetical protein